MSGSVSLGCIVTYRIPGVDLDAMMLSLFTTNQLLASLYIQGLGRERKCSMNGATQIDISKLLSTDDAG